MNIQQEMFDLAEAGLPNEVCGLVAQLGSEVRLVPAKNLYSKPREGFDLDPEAWLAVAEGEEVIGIYHSHPVSSAEPSVHDLVMCEASGLPWHIVNPQTREYRLVEPSGYRAPYEKRPYIHAVLDCYSICRDWYSREWQLILPEFEREERWWEKGANLYEENFRSCGFVKLEAGTPLEVGDALLMQRGARVTNHAGIYVGNNSFLHHPMGRVSSVDVYGGEWLRRTTHHLRHESRMKNG